MMIVQSCVILPARLQREVGCVGGAPVCRAALFGAAREEHQGI
jgi:hypothetical protein